MQVKPHKDHGTSGNSKLDIFMQYESSEPISLSRINEIWSSSVGEEHVNKWILNRDGRRVESNEDIIVSEDYQSEYESVFDVNSITQKENDLKQSNILS